MPNYISRIYRDAPVKTSTISVAVVKNRNRMHKLKGCNKHIKPRRKKGR